MIKNKEIQIEVDEKMKIIKEKISLKNKPNIRRISKTTYEINGTPIEFVNDLDERIKRSKLMGVTTNSVGFIFDR